jgi:branched-chain amino acid transport system permease protein
VSGTLLLALFVVLAVVPALVPVDAYWLSLGAKLYLNAMIAISMWPLFVIGRLTLAHAAFYGLGAYGAAVLMVKFGWSFWLALPVAVLFVSVLALVLGLPTLRVHGAYFVIATFAFGEVVRLAYLRFEEPFGGAQGLFGIPTATPIHVPGLPPVKFDSFIGQYYLVFAGLAMLTLGYYRYVHSYLGLVMRSIHHGRQQSQALGVNVFAYEMVTFMVTAAGAALAGALYAVYARYLDPNLFGFHKSVDAQAYVIIGGAGFALGPILGAAYMTVVPEYLNMAKESAPIITGASLVLTMLFLRGGLVSLPARLVGLARAVRRLRGGAPRPASTGLVGGDAGERRNVAGDG